MSVEVGALAWNKYSSMEGTRSSKVEFDAKVSALHFQISQQAAFDLNVHIVQCVS